jgi:hypothetical protein
MKIPIHSSGKFQRGVLEIDLAMAMLVLTVAIMPLAFTFEKERTVLRVEYCRALADEIVDGEMEILAAGNWKNLPDGSSVYTVHSRAAANLPAGHFELTKNAHQLRLEWLPNKRVGIGVVAREITAP